MSTFLVLPQVPPVPQTVVVSLIGYLLVVGKEKEKDVTVREGEGCSKDPLSQPQETMSEFLFSETKVIAAGLKENKASNSDRITNEHVMFGEGDICL